MIFCRLESQQRTEKMEKAALQSEIDSQAQEVGKAPT